MLKASTETVINNSSDGSQSGAISIGSGANAGKVWMPIEDPVSRGDRVRHDGCRESKCQNDTSGKSKSLLAREWIHWCVAAFLMAAAGALATYYDMGRIQAVLFVAAGACAGYFTNDLAITLLLWPTEKKLKGMLHGVFFKRRDEFGDKLIKTAREQILNDAFFTEMINAEKVEIFLKEILEKEINGLLQADIGNPQTLLDKFFDDKGVQGEFVDRLAAWSGNYLSRKFVDGIDEEIICSTVKQLQSSTDGSLAGFLLDDGGRMELFLEKWVAEIIKRNAANQIEEMLVYIEEEVEGSEKRLQDLFDDDARRGFETSVLNYLQSEVVSAILNKLESPEARQKLSAFIQNETTNLAENYFQRISGLKAWLLKVFGSSDIDRLIDEIPQVVDKMLGHFRNSAKNGLLDRYVAELSIQLFPKLWSWKFGDIYRQLPKGLVKNIGAGALNLIESGKVQSGLVERISTILRNELTRSSGPDQPLAGSGTDEFLRYFAGKLEELLQENSVRDGISRIVRITAREHIVGALSQPIGAMKDFPVFRSEIVKTISGKCALLVLVKIKTNVNALVQQLPVEEMLAKCWNSLTNRQIQQQVQGVLSTEFQILVNLGISFGSLVAFVLISVQALTGAAGALIFLAAFIPVCKLAKSRLRATE